MMFRSSPGSRRNGEAGKPLGLAAETGNALVAQD